MAFVNVSCTAMFATGVTVWSVTFRLYCAQSAEEVWNANFMRIEVERKYKRGERLGLKKKELLKNVTRALK